MFTFIFFLHALEGKEIVVQEAVAVNTMVDILAFIFFIPILYYAREPRKKKWGVYK